MAPVVHKRIEQGVLVICSISAIKLPNRGVEKSSHLKCREMGPNQQYSFIFCLRFLKVLKAMESGHTSIFVQIATPGDSNLNEANPIRLECLTYQLPMLLRRKVGETQPQVYLANPASAPGEMVGQKANKPPQL